MMGMHFGIYHCISLLHFTLCMAVYLAGWPAVCPYMCVFIASPYSLSTTAFGPVPIQTLLLIVVCLAGRQKSPHCFFKYRNSVCLARSSTHPLTAKTESWPGTYRPRDFVYKHNLWIRQIFRPFFDHQLIHSSGQRRDGLPFMGRRRLLLILGHHSVFPYFTPWQWWWHIVMVQVHAQLYCAATILPLNGNGRRSCQYAD